MLPLPTETTAEATNISAAEAIPPVRITTTIYSDTLNTHNKTSYAQNRSQHRCPEVQGNLEWERVIVTSDASATIIASQ